MKDISSDFKYAIELSYVRKGRRSNRGRITCNLITKTVQARRAGPDSMLILCLVEIRGPHATSR